MSAYDERPGPDWQLLARRIVIGTLITTAVLLVLGMVLSYAGLRSAYLGAGFVDWAASAAPLCVDLLTLVGYVALLVLTGKVYPACIVAFGVLASAGAQGYHQSHGGINAVITSGWIVFALGASCVIFAGLAGHLAWKILERALPGDFISAMRGAAATLYDAAPTPPLPASNPRDLHLRENDAQWQELLRGETELDDKQVDKLIEQVQELNQQADGHLSAAERAALDHLGSRPGPYAGTPEPNGSRPHAATIHRPRPHQVTQRTGQPSQAVGPCAEGCQHHTGDVSKSARYRCAATLAGRSDVCAPCKSTREGQS